MKLTIHRTLRRTVVATLTLAAAGLFTTPGLLSAVTGTADDPGRMQAPFFRVRAVSDPARPESAAPQAVATATSGPIAARSLVLGLSGTKVKAEVVGPIVRVTLTQTYVNHGTVPLEATYVFPGSTRSAVHGMTMTVGDRRRVARIMEKKAAQAGFEAAKKAGQGAALLEQHRPNVFQMNVTNVMPGQSVKVELEYSERISGDRGVFEWVFPTVVGPRYDGGQNPGAPQSPVDVESLRAAPAGGSRPESRSLRDGDPGFELDLTVLPGAHLADLTSPSHDLQVLQRFGDHAVVRVASGASRADDRDVVIRWSVRDRAIQSSALILEGDQEGYFLVNVEPPSRDNLPVPGPREYVFIVDVSGSMAGFPLDVARSLMDALLGRLRHQDRFNVVLFAGDSAVLADVPVEPTPENLANARNLLSRQGGGATELLPALRRALELPRAVGTSRTVIVVTDGFVTCEAAAFELVRRNLGRGNVFALGVGTSVNRHLIESLARAGQGEPFVALDAADAASVARRLGEVVDHPVLTDVTMRFEGFTAHSTIPPSSTERKEPTGGDADVGQRHRSGTPSGPALAGPTKEKSTTLALPDLLAQRPITVVGRFDGAATGHVTVTGRQGDRPFTARIDLSQARKGSQAAALRHLWAREQIALLADAQAVSPSAGTVDAITKLGLEYGLLTEYTSFLAVDERVVNRGGVVKPMVQELPLPAGVEVSALGSTVPTAPEPHEWLLVAVALAFVALAGATPSKGPRGDR